MDELTELQNRFCHNEDEVDRLEKENASLLIQITKMKWGISVGAIIKETRSGKLHRVLQIQNKSWARLDKPWVVANPIRSDGTYGTARRSLFDNWVLIKNGTNDV